MNLKDIIPKEAVLVGRFQPFHKGHLRAYNYLARKYDIANIALVERKSGKRDEDNPLSVVTRENLIKKVLPGVKVYRVPTLYYEGITSAIGHEVVVGVGEDRAKAIRGMKEAKYEIISRARESATLVRKALRENDKQAFKSLMPKKLHGEFETLREAVT